jgi:hypothetical protein
MEGVVTGDSEESVDASCGTTIADAKGVGD